ncbi:hypothetical protein [Prevotella sp. AGR2160]|uniref:hypothetical protein n=1 Tax=Prevotella sp. AGR2160 TaxID=1280674 RepID=UPI00048A505F|nr:hypothetical protein [Prevotella sp. AGR2160]
MKRKVEKKAKIALCRLCHGTGLLRHKDAAGHQYERQCPQCEGSGRVKVSAVMEFDIKPYKG